MTTSEQQLNGLPGAIGNRQSKIGNRRGVTLTEVLMAIFVMGIGMISLLVLFPVGMHNMVQAIKNDRVGVASTSATNFAELLSLRRDDYVVGDVNNPTLRVGSMYYLLGAAPSFMPAVPAVPQMPPPQQPPYLMGGSPLNGWWVYQYYPNAPSPPVFIDPIGGYAYPRAAGAAQIGYGIFPTTQVNFGVPRSSVSLIENARVTAPARLQEFLQRWFTQGDDIGFDEYGQAFPAPPVAPVERDRAYSWAYVWRRPRFSDPETVDLTVVIFKNRKIIVDTSLFPDPPDVAYRGPLQLDPGTNQLVYRPVFLPYSPSMDPATPNGYAKELQRPNTAIIGWNPTIESQPTIKRGDWLFDATVMPGLPPYRVASPTVSGVVSLPPGMPLPPAQLHVPYTTAGNPPTPNFTLPPEYPPPYFNGYFYKVVGVSEPLQPDLNNPNELQIQLELDRPVRNVGFACVVLPDVVDVIEKSDGLKTQTTIGP